MSQRKRVLLVFVIAVTLLASIIGARLIYLSGFVTYEHRLRNAHVFTKKHSPLSCKGVTHRAAESHDGLFYVDSERKIVLNLAKIRIEHWQKRAAIVGSNMTLPFDENDSAAADLAPGESFTYEGVGTITLLNVEIDWVGLALSGEGENIATYCFEPAPGFKVSDEYKSRYEKEHPNEPLPWPSPTEEQ